MNFKPTAVFSSLIDQQHKQTLHFAGGELVGNFDGQLYVAANSCVACLMPQPWTTQVEVSILYLLSYLLS